MKEAPISILDMIMKEGLQFININPKQGEGQGGTLFNPNITPDVLWHLVNCEKTTKDRLIKVHDDRQ